MHQRIFEDDDKNLVMVFDEEAIDYFIEGLEELRNLEPGEEMATPSVTTDVDGIPTQVGTMILRRWDEEDE